MSVAYCGRNYAGWAKQRDQSTVQQHLEAALSRVAAHPVEVQCAGRTDRGVHATHQVVHFDTTAQRLDDNWLRGTNAYLPEDIRVVWVRAVEEQFHARFSATARRYWYCIHRGQAMACGMRGWVTHVPWDLNVEQMNHAAELLLGEHDFSAYRGSGCQSRSVKRCIELAQCLSMGSWLVFDIKANAFLLHMVRNIMGVLLAVGQGQNPASWAGDLLQQRDRRLAAATAPADGLYLVQVDYPELWSLPAGTVPPWFLSGSAQQLIHANVNGS